MAESLLSFKRLDWKWVWITLGLYAAFYFLPIYLIGTIVRPHITWTPTILHFKKSTKK